MAGAFVHTMYPRLTLSILVLLFASCRRLGRNWEWEEDDQRQEFQNILPFVLVDVELMVFLSLSFTNQEFATFFQMPYNLQNW